MNNIKIIIGGKELTFAVTVKRDDDHGAPWEESEGHGPVSEWVSRDKRPGELVLNTDRGRKRFYDYAEACRIALAEGWDARPYNDGSETKRQQAAKAAMADYDMLRKWCANLWEYVGVTVTLLDDDGEPTEVSNSLWGVDDFDQNYPAEVASDLAGELAHGYGTRWGEVTVQTFGYLNSAVGE